MKHQVKGRQCEVIGRKHQVKGRQRQVIGRKYQLKARKCKTKGCKASRKVANGNASTNWLAKYVFGGRM